jgi:beta-aspartyl-peptidase (threonine type)
LPPARGQQNETAVVDGADRVGGGLDTAQSFAYIPRMNMMVLANDVARNGIGIARRALQEGRSALDAVEFGIRDIEADTTVESVGLGGSPNILGRMECDAAIMDGSNQMAGSVGALGDYLHAISVARKVMELLPHVMLTGAGADRFAREIRAEERVMLTAKAKARYEEWLVANVPAEARATLDTVPLAEYVRGSAKGYVSGTTVFLAIDSQGRMAGGTSTSGWANSYPGRLGDSPIIGAGLYVDQRFGACGCTHIGEMTIRCATARSVVLYLKNGASVQEACAEAIRDLRGLKGGTLGPVIVHAIDCRGNPCVMCNQELPSGFSYYFWRDGLAEIEQDRMTVLPEGK